MIFRTGIVASSLNSSSFDADAQAFIDATEITDSALQTAINDLVLASKANGWWSKCVAIYPFISDGVMQTRAYQHKWNLKNPVDSDAAFRLTFSGGITHSATGADPNGSTGVADTHCVPSSDLTDYDTHISFYSGEDVNEATVDMGTMAADSSKRITIALYSETAYNDHADGLSDRLSYATGGTTGYYMTTRSSATRHECYQNGTSKGTDTNTRTYTAPTWPILLFSTSNTDGGNSSKEFRFATIGAGIDDTMASDMSTDINNFQTTLGRNTY